MGITTDDRSTNEQQSSRWRRGRVAAVAALLVALTLVLGACSGDDSSDAGSDTASEAFETTFAAQDTDDAGGDDAMAEDEATSAEGADRALADGDGEAANAAETPSPLGAGGVKVTPTAADLGRKLIFTAFLTVGVEDVSAASVEATTIIEDLGGFLFGQSTEGGPEARSELTFKILPDDFNLALERLGAVGELRNQTITTDDVTERVVDLESRIEVAELGVTRLRAALEGTQSLEDYAEVERLLLERESDLEVMRGQLRTLQDRIDLATITLTLTQERVENQVAIEATVYDGHDEGRSCPAQTGLAVEQGTDVTVCFEITNLGDQTLTDIVLTDSVLEIDTGGESPTELIAVFGDLGELAPGQSVLLAYETDVERTTRLRTRVVATPTDGVDAEAVGPSVNAQASTEIQTYPSEDGPGFGSGFGAAVDVLQGLWTAVTVTLGFLIPLLILAPFAWLIRQGVDRVRSRRPPRRPAGGGQGSPPPPPPSASPSPPPPVPVDPDAEATPIESDS